MQGWHTPYLGLRELPREFSQFELRAFFTFGRAELELIERAGSARLNTQEPEISGLAANSIFLSSGPCQAAGGAPR